MPSKPSMPDLRSMKRQSVQVSAESLVDFGDLEPGRTLPRLVEPAEEKVDLFEWAESNSSRIEDEVCEHGGVLFRGFGLDAPEDLEELIGRVTERPLEYTERSSPRSRVQGNIYTSTDHPADQRIYLHNEQSYNLVFPLRIFFFCVVPADQDGETPTADCRKVYRRIDPEIRSRFEAQGYMYVRNFGGGMGLSWQEAFQTEDREEVERYCEEHDIELEWKEGDRLRTRQVRQAVATHPKTGEKSWCNHATFFHVSTLDPSTREAVLAEFDEEDLPNNTYYGDGSPIEPEVLDHLRSAYDGETVAFPWRRGDLLMLDNMLVAHGRRPYSGERQIVVGMSKPFPWEKA